MIFVSYSSIIVKLLLAFPTSMKVKICLNNGSNCSLIVKVDFFFLFQVDKLFIENTLISEYIECINTDMLTSSSDEINTLYTAVFRHMYKAIQPLDYYSNELVAYIGILNQLSKWPNLVRVTNWIDLSFLNFSSFFVFKRLSFDCLIRKLFQIVLRCPIHRAVVEPMKTHSSVVFSRNHVYHQYRANLFFSSKNRRPWPNAMLKSSRAICGR